MKRKSAHNYKKITNTKIKVIIHGLQFNTENTPQFWKQIMVIKTPTSLSQPIIKFGRMNKTLKK
jgi:hypothetical protein